MVSQGGQQAIKPFCEDNMTGSVSCGVSVDKEEEEERAVPLQFSYGDFTDVSKKSKDRLRDPAL